MKRTNIFIASSSEMHHERLELVDLFTDMCSDTMEYIPVKWEYMDSSVHKEHKQSEYMRRLQKCEICIVMFWRSLGEYTEKELSLALKEQQSGQEHNLQKTFILIKEDGEPISLELSEFKKKCVQEHGDIVHSFSNSQELRELARNLVLSANVKCNESNWNGKELKVMIAADEELNEEKLEFTELMAHLNEVLENRGIRLRRVKWAPKGADDYQKELRDCEMCLNLYWRKLPQQADEEMKAAYNLSTNGSNPQHLYIFFKEPSNDISTALADFKAGFETVYGHFFCKFENVDTMNLHFILQFEARQNQVGESCLMVNNGQVLIDGKSFINLDNVPFACFNKEYCRLQAKVSALEEDFAIIHNQQKENPSSENIMRELSNVEESLKQAREEYNRYQGFLIKKALGFARFSKEEASERMRMARKLFEIGDAAEAARLMDVNEIKKIKTQNRELWKLQIERRVLEIKELEDSASYAMTDPKKTMQERFMTACDAYEEAIDTAVEIRYEDEEMAELQLKYAQLLHEFNQIDVAINHYNDSLKLYKNMVRVSPARYLPKVALILNDRSTLQRDMLQYSDAEQGYNEALSIYEQLSEMNLADYSSNIAAIHNNLGILLTGLQKYNKAKLHYSEALKIRYHLADISPDFFLPDVARTLNNLANLQTKIKEYSEAEKNYSDAIEIRSRFVKDFPDIYLPLVASTQTNLAGLLVYLNRHEEAIRYYTSALKTYIGFADDNPIKYLPKVAVVLTDLASSQAKLKHDDDAEENYYDAMNIYITLNRITRDEYRPQVVSLFNNIGLFHIEKQKYAEAEQELSYATGGAHVLLEVNRKVFLKDVAMTMWNMILLYLSWGQSSPDPVQQFKKLYACLLEVLPIYEELEFLTPGLYSDRINDVKYMIDKFKPYFEK